MIKIERVRSENRGRNQKPVPMILLILFVSLLLSCRHPMMGVWNKTESDIQFLIDSKDSIVYAYLFEARHVSWYEFMDKTDFLIRYPNTKLNRDTMDVSVCGIPLNKKYSKELTPPICGYDSLIQRQYNPNILHGTFVYTMPEEYRSYKKNCKKWINKYVDTNVNSLTILYSKNRIIINDPLMIKKFFISEWWKIPYIPRIWNDSEIKITKKKLKKWKKFE